MKSGSLEIRKLGHVRYGGEGGIFPYPDISVGLLLRSRGSAYNLTASLLYGKRGTELKRGANVRTSYKPCAMPASVAYLLLEYDPVRRDENRADQ